LIVQLFTCAVYLLALFAAAAILPVVQKQHQLLVTLLLCNAVAMEVENLGSILSIITLFCTLQLNICQKNVC